MTSPTLSRIAIMALAAVVCGILIVLLVTRSAWTPLESRGETATEISGSDPAAGIRSQPAARDAPGRSAVAEGVAAPTLTVRVQDPTGRPVADAAVSLVPESAPWLGHGSRTRIGELSDASGIIRLTVDELAAAKRAAGDPRWRFVVEHPDHLPAELPIAPPETEVTLGHAATLVVECLTAGGDPVAGVAVGVSQFVEFEALRTAVTHALRVDEIPRPGPCSFARAVHVAVTDVTGLARVRGCAPGRYAWVAGHRTMVPVDGPEKAVGLQIPGSPLRLVMAPLVGACVQAATEDPVLSVNVDWNMSQFDRGPLSRRGGIASALCQAGPDTPEGLRVDVPSAELLRTGRFPEIKYSVLFPSGWTHVVVPMLPTVDGIETTLVEPPPGPDLTGTLVLALSGVPDSPEIAPHLPFIQVMGSGGEGMFCRIPRCGDPVRLPAGEYRLMSANPWIDTSQIVQIQAGAKQHVELPLTRELRPCKMVPMAPPGAVLPSLNIWIGKRADSKAVGLRFRSWVAGLEHEDPEQGATQWLPVGELVIGVKGRGVVESETSVVVAPSWERQTVAFPVEVDGGI